MNIEEMLTSTANNMRYPATPQIQLPILRQYHRQMILLRVAITLVISLLLLGSMLAVPPVRAAIFDLLKIGSISFVDETPEGTITKLVNATGKTTLEQAQFLVPFPIYAPPTLSEPDEVYLQQLNSANPNQQMLVLIWKNKQHPDQVDLALYQISPLTGGFKGTTKIEMTNVDGNPAAWIEEPHLLWFDSDGKLQQQPIFLVEDRVLIWEAGGITYRLESKLSQEEAIELAESLAPIGNP